MIGTTRPSPFPAPREGADNPTIPPPITLTQTSIEVDPIPRESDSLWPADTQPEPATSLWASVSSSHSSQSHTGLDEPSAEHAPPQTQTQTQTQTQVDDESAQTQPRGRTRAGSRRALRIFVILTVVSGAVAFVASKEPWSRLYGSADSESATAVSTGPSWIASGKYSLPDDIEPGVYRVGREYTIYDRDDKVVRKSPATSEGTTLLAIPESDLDGSIEIAGGAWPLKDDGPVDPTRFQAGTYLVNYDIQPGTYQVTLVPRPRGDGIASATRLDENNNIIQTEQVDDSDPTDSVIIVVEPTDFGFSFVGELEKID